MEGQDNKVKSCNWFGTHNNPEMPTDEWLRTLKEQKGVRYVLGQLEQGQEGTRHIQFVINLEQAQRLSYMKKLCPKSHWEVIRVVDAAVHYCMKQETRVEGPFEYGVRPVVKRNKESVEEARAKKAETNKQIMEMGAESAIQQGFANMKDYKHLKQSMDLYRLNTMDPYVAEDVRGIWFYGPSGYGKTHRARTQFPQHYVKPQNKWFDGYTG